MAMKGPFSSCRTTSISSTTSRTSSGSISSRAARAFPPFQAQGIVSGENGRGIAIELVRRNDAVATAATFAAFVLAGVRKRRAGPPDEGRERQGDALSPRRRWEHRKSRLLGIVTRQAKGQRVGS